MAILLDAGKDNEVQVLGQLPDDSIGQVILNLTSRYDKNRYIVIGSGVNAGKWIRISIPQSNIPDYGGLYNSTVSTTERRPLTLSNTIQSLSEISVSLSNFVGFAINDRLIDNLLISVVGTDGLTVTENEIRKTLTEYVIQTQDKIDYGDLNNDTTEYEINADEDTAYSALDNSRTTYHNDRN